jgi:hypothetical protein
VLASPLTDGFRDEIERLTERGAGWPRRVSDASRKGSPNPRGLQSRARKKSVWFSTSIAQAHTHRAARLRDLRQGDTASSCSRCRCRRLRRCSPCRGAAARARPLVRSPTQPVCSATSPRRPAAWPSRSKADTGFMASSGSQCPAAGSPVLPRCSPSRRTSWTPSAARCQVFCRLAHGCTAKPSQ